MGIDLAPLLEPLAKGTDSDLDALDERLLAMDEHAAKGRFDQAAEICAKLFAEGIYDLRPLPYLLHAAFLDGGVPSLEQGLRVIENLLGPSRAALSPSKRQEGLINKRLAWFFDTVDRAIRYHREHNSEVWARIGGNLQSEPLEQTLAACERLTGPLSSPETAEASRALGQLAIQLRDLRALVEAPSQAPAPAQAPAPPAKTPPAAAEPATTPGTARERPELTCMSLRVSQPFIELCRRLEAAQTLLGKKDFLRAAVVVESIGRCLESFDPRRCFPELFAPFAALVAQHASPLEDATQAQGSSVWKALAQYADVDLRGFLEAKP
jgi:hypothetical protein